jgi:hypothetical protein
MGKNVIGSEETIRDLLEAHASLSAWYYELWGALRAAGGTVRPPDDAARSAFVERLASDFPEVSQVVRSIGVPRAFVPAPAQLASSSHDEPATLIEPAPARVRLSQPSLEAVRDPLSREGSQSDPRGGSNKPPGR